MIGLIITLLLSSVLLVLTGTLSLLEASFFLLTGSVALSLISYQSHQKRHRLVFRSHEIGATSAIAVRHLGGLPFPIPTEANLFIGIDFIRVETDHDHWQSDRLQLNRIVIMSAEQIHQLPDRDIILALSGGTSRLLSLVREKIRRGDSAVRRSKLLFLTFEIASENEQTVENEQIIVICSFSDTKNMQKILKREDLADRVVDFLPDAG
ncbi:MAG: hypothetical protein PHC86_03730 [Eubacteriales bacterium]|nr:hypothetical protein [Eubacteriales bacterium]